MINYFLRKYGVIASTAIISILCILFSELITLVVWKSFNQPYIGAAILVAFICPALIAPTVIYFYSRLSEELYQSQQRLEQSNRELQVEITERRQAEKALRENETILRQMQKMESVGILAGGIAHDFNNILAIILGNADMALFMSSEESPAKRHIERIVQASDRARRMVQQILAFSRQEKQGFVPINPASIFMETFQLLRSTIPTSVEIRPHISKDCGTIKGNPTQLNQVLINLCNNAVDAMDEKGLLEITVDKIRLAKKDLPHASNKLSPGYFVQLAVSDSGKGMAPEVVEKIFDPFFTTKEVEKGSGLGLSVVHGIVGSHGGMMTVESEPDKGSTFRVFFPIIDQPSVQDNVAPPILATGDEQILIVDDEEPVAATIGDILRLQGYGVTTISSSTEALEIFRKDPSRFDLIVTDQTMPEMSGSELSSELLAIRPDLPIILYTGYSSKISRESAIKSGIRELLMKPVDTAELAQAVRKILDNSYIKRNLEAKHQLLSVPEKAD